MAAPSSSRPDCATSDPTSTGSRLTTSSRSNDSVVPPKDFDRFAYIPVAIRQGFQSASVATQNQSAMQLGGSPPSIPPVISRNPGHHMHRHARPENSLPPPLSCDDDEFSNFDITQADLEALDEADQKINAGTFTPRLVPHRLSPPASALLLRTEEGRNPLNPAEADLPSNYALRPVSPCDDAHDAHDGAFKTRTPPPSSSHAPAPVFSSASGASIEDSVAPKVADLSNPFVTNSGAPPITTLDRPPSPTNALEIDPTPATVNEVEDVEYDQLHAEGDQPEGEAERRMTSQVRECVLRECSAIEEIVKSIAARQKLQVYQVWAVILSHYQRKGQTRDTSNAWNQYRPYFVGNHRVELRRIFPTKTDEELDEVEHTTAVQSACYKAFKKDHPDQWQKILDTDSQIRNLNADVTVHQRRKQFTSHSNALQKLATHGHKMFGFESAVICVGNNVNQDQQLGMLYESEGAVGLLKRAMRADTDDEVIGHAKSHVVYRLSEQVLDANHDAQVNTAAEPPVNIASLNEHELNDFIKTQMWDAIEKVRPEGAAHLRILKRFPYKKLPYTLAFEHNLQLRIVNYPFGIPWFGAQTWPDGRNMEKGLSLMTMLERRTLADALTAKEGGLRFEDIPKADMKKTKVLVISTTAPPASDPRKQGTRIYVDKAGALHVDKQGVRRDEYSGVDLDAEPPAVRRSTRSTKRSAKQMAEQSDDTDTSDSSDLPDTIVPRKKRRHPSPSPRLPSASPPTQAQHRSQPKKARRQPPVSCASSHSSDVEILSRAPCKPPTGSKGKNKASGADSSTIEGKQIKPNVFVSIPKTQVDLTTFVDVSEFANDPFRPPQPSKPKPRPRPKYKLQPAHESTTTVTMHSGASSGQQSEGEGADGCSYIPTTPTPLPRELPTQMSKKGKERERMIVQSQPHISHPPPRPARPPPVRATEAPALPPSMSNSSGGEMYFAPLNSSTAFHAQPGHSRTSNTSFPFSDIHNEDTPMEPAFANAPLSAPSELPFMNNITPADMEILIAYLRQTTRSNHANANIHGQGVPSMNPNPNGPGHVSQSFPDISEHPQQYPGMPAYRENQNGPEN